MKRILIINGPNLNLLGKREPEIYGTKTLADLEKELAHAFPDSELHFFQSNHEGDLIDKIQEQVGAPSVRGIVLNPGAYTHTSVALLDALKALTIPVVEVHLSNIHAREEFRRHSITAQAAKGIIAGFGFESYKMAIRYLLENQGAY
jgi:3-dehydroquinate dehydratase-2